MNKGYLSLFLLLFALALFAVVADQPVAQTKVEICDNGIDDDDDKLIDCADSDCAKECTPDGDACSPGYWKNHTEVWFGVCCTGADCDKILSDLQAGGPGSQAIRQAAADFLEACLGRPCNDD